MPSMHTYKTLLFALLFGIATAVQAQGEFRVGEKIVHTVVEGQTLFSIAKGYKVQVADVLSANDDMGESFAISPGQQLSIPISGEANDDVADMLSKLTKTAQTHVAAPKETAYSISKQYGITLKQLSSWNNIIDNAISIDQELIVGYQYSAEDSASMIPPTMKTVSTNQSKTGILNPANGQVSRKPSVNKQDALYQKYLADKEGKSAGNEKGVANWFKTENRMMASNYYGMMDNVSVGSIVEVINPMNGSKVYVKIIGSLPSTSENSGALIKLTPVAKEALGGVDGKLRVEVNYFN